MIIHHKNRYDKLIKFYQDNLVDGFLEKHHILPRCMGGNDDKENLVLLPVRVHFIAHYLLYKTYPENEKLAHAFAMMGVNNKFQHRSSKLYEKSRIARSLALKGKKLPEHVKAKMRKPKSEETKMRMRKPKSVEHRNKISSSNKGKPKSVQSVEKMKLSKKPYFEELAKRTEEKCQFYRNKFLELSIPRTQFYLMFPDINPSTLKRYLKGL